MDTVELVAATVVAGGDALAREAGGRVVFVPGALPGERVLVGLVEQRKDFARARVLEVIEPSSHRVRPPCAFVAAGCGGCTWQHVAPQEQRSLKVGIVKDALRRTGRLDDARVEEAAPLATQDFRTTVRLAVADGQPGFRRASSHELVPVDACLVAHPRLDDLIAASYPGAHEVTVRCGATTGERLVVVEPSGATAVAMAGLPHDVARGPDACYHDEVRGHRLRVSARSFFQTRHDGAEALVAAVEAAAGPALTSASRAIDAYGGVGLFAATLLRHTEITLVELARSSVLDARHNLAGLAATVVEADLARFVPAHEVDLVIADPARAGLDRRAARALAGAGAPTFVLVSCDPVSLARDARLLDGLGYRHVRSTLVDLFPHTPHVEVVTRFERR